MFLILQCVYYCVFCSLNIIHYEIVTTKKPQNFEKSKADNFSSKKDY